MVGEQQLRAWLREAKPGDTQVYYLGFLAADRVVTEMVDGKLTDRPIEPINTIADLMMAAKEAGEVELWQQRVGDFEYKYWARRL